MTDPVAAAWHALRRSAVAAGCEVRLRAAAATPWWSATFSGHRVVLTLGIVPGAVPDAWLASLAEIHLPLPGRLVADCAVDRAAGAATATVALLVLDDA